MKEVINITKNVDHDETTKKRKIAYKIEEKPPALMSFLLGFQQFLTMIGGCVAYPYVVANIICMRPDDINKIYLMQTVFLTSGLATVMQVMFGVRLPLIQGPSLSFLIPILAMSDLPGNQCPSHDQLANMTETEYHDLWSTKLVNIQGSVIIVGFVCFLFGCFGLIGRFLNYISPVIIGPTIIQLGLSFAKVSIGEAAKSWRFSILTIVLMLLFTQYLDRFYILFPRFNKNETEKSNGNRSNRFHKIFIFRLFPVVCTIVTVWSFAAICTYYDWIPAGNEARVDGEKMSLMTDSPYFHVPLPLQFGFPQISSQIVLGIVSAMCVCVIETIGNYFACAQLSEAPSPPKHAINRGVAMEGLGTCICGFFGTGGGVTSYSENISCIAMTKVASRQVVLNSALIMIVVSVFAKLAGFFSTMPSPIIGGILFIICGIITAVGISVIQFVNMDETRNLFIVGIAIFSGASLPEYFKAHSSDLNFGIPWLDHLLIVLITNSLMVTLICAFVLDNTIRCNDPRDRGIQKWLQLDKEEDDNLERERDKVFSLPGSLDRLRGKRLSKILPIFPYKKKEEINISSSV